MKKSCDI